jgi:HlyD family secretion protein
VIILGSTINNPSGQSNAGFYKDFVSVSDTANRDRISLLVAAAQNDYTDARAKYDEVFLLYKNTSRYADSPAIINLLDKTAELNKSLAQALKSEKNVLDFITDYASANSKSVPSLINFYQTTLRTDIGKTNGFISTLIDAQNSLENAPLDIKSQELAVKQKENALLDAQDKLADYFIRAPFDGVIAKVDVTKGDSVSPASIIATLITRQKLAEISLNEVDVAKVKVGQKATLTFDAVPDLSITGQVTEVDTVGTISQGVVTYTVKISFDTQDNRVKPGMSVSAAIVTEAKPNVLLVPNSAVKSQGGMSYVEIVEGDDRNTALAANATGVILKNTPRRQQVEIGTASDEFTEVTSGLKEGDVIVTRTIQPTAAKTTQTQQQSGGLRIPGLTGGGGGR